MTTFPPFFRICVAIAFLFVAASAQAVLLTFESSTDLSGNFRFGADPDPTLTSNGASNDFVLWGTGNGSTIVYDTTPADITSATNSVFTVSSTVALVVTAKFAIQNSNGSFGLIITDPTNTNSNTGHLVVFNTTGSTDQMRVIIGVNASTGSTTSSTIPFDQSADAGVNPSTSVFSDLRLEYYINASNQPVYHFTVGTMDRTYIGTAGTGFTTFQLALRNNTNSTGTNRFDDFSIDLVAIPEPAAPMIAAAALTALSPVRRRRRG